MSESEPVEATFRVCFCRKLKYFSASANSRVVIPYSLLGGIVKLGVYVNIFTVLHAKFTHDITKSGD